MSRQQIQLERGFVLWFTGLSGAGKSTLSSAVAKRLRSMSCPHELLDGDEVRRNLSKGLGFSKEDRDTNIRRIGYVARLLARNRVVAMVAAISPYSDLRAEQRSLVEADGASFCEVFVDCDLDVLIKRDPKGLYARALAGEIQNFTGVSDPYERPDQPDIWVHTDGADIEATTDQIMARLVELGFLPPVD